LNPEVRSIGSEALRPRLSKLGTTPLRDSLYTFRNVSIAAWLGITSEGFPEFTSFFDLDYSRKLPTDRDLLYH